ncbi:5-formyltetrahydrofolate cyclo-ligase [Flaviflagellibacter deserti]|uniref:5-formyltetrahydrofolate cyclo-ligase n=1 Tax=Flaviflagellibacter deserti TaxID=2267266 RepID=A0ABV9YY00_9HYPH
MTADSDAAQAEKAALRTAKIAARRALDDGMAHRAAERAAEHAMHVIHEHSKEIVALYMPILGELKPAPLAERLRKAGATLSLPRVVTATRPMQFLEWREEDPLAKGYGGIREPDPQAPKVVPDVVVVPLSAFDRRGFRIGYGKGHYDRTLGPLARHERPLMIGYAFALQEVDEVPRELHDVPLDAVVTEDEIIRCNLGREGL